ncbi:MAG: S-methyl-5'-thioadenosine phosphorylase [Bacillota bacterium]
MAPKVAIIGGTGVYDPQILSNLREEKVDTAYGTVQVQIGTRGGREIAFMARHGAGHSVPPHRVNYRANIRALKELGVQRILATASVGSLEGIMAPGHLAILDQFLDFTKSRPSTFHEGGDQGVVHIDMTDPYCQELRRALTEAGSALRLKMHLYGTYVCTEGPRFETPAEIKMYAKMGGQLVGMTNVPEVVLAREAEICYATVAIITNYAAGISTTPLSHKEVVDAMRTSISTVRELLLRAVDVFPADRKCACGHAAQELGQF